MTEIEVKILEIDREQVAKRLDELGATISFDDEMEAVFFDFEDGRINALGNLLRLRREGKQSVLTFKKPISTGEAKIMQEHETGISNTQALKSILSLLGLKPTKQTHKHRIQYTLGDTHIVIDDYKGELAAIPVFLEIEAPNIERLYEVVELLGFSKEDCNDWNTYDLVKHYL